ncbi:hypothetical protein GLOIN_2v1779563 [Rhizophagus irregularis DAOM 181602=DAOM 197198]|nr:hypothetical protein GLOIN_2v1779563 [Rhizophagus irregularis DAOM 181602=DAOM 197198]
MPVAISIQELRESITERLKAKHDEEKFSTISVPSNDKHKVPIREIVETSTGVRNKATLAFADMDSALRHSAEWLKCLRKKYTILPEMLVIYTDGGADHQTTFGSVQLAMICLFLEGDFNFLAAVRTAPYHSWSNSAERIMSIINLGLQGVALKRSDMSSDSEKVFKNLGTMEEIRNAALYNQTLSEKMKIAIKDTQEILQNRTTRLKLHNQKFKCIDPAYLILRIFIPGMILHYRLFIFFEIITFTYIGYFKIKKCGKNECVICGSIRLPQEIFNQLHFIPDPQISSDPDHYQNFNSLYGRNTTEIDLPSKKNNLVCQELAPNGMLVVARVRDFALCTSCTKLRCIFSKYVLRESDSEILQTAMETFAYTCGSPIVPENHPLYNKVFVGMNLTCDSPIEQTYYLCRIEHSQVCYYCGEEDNLINPSPEVLSRFRIVYPLCEVCQENGVTFFTKGKLQMKKKQCV